VDVYVAGFVSDRANYHYPSYDDPYIHSSADHAVYWKNGSLVQLNIESARGYAIAVSGTDVYVAGEYQFSSPTHGAVPHGMCWKNGISLDLYYTEPVYEMKSVAVSNNDVYMTGPSLDPNAYYRKNNNWMQLGPVFTSTGLPIGSDASSITVSGNDLYVAGQQWEQLAPGGGWTKAIASYWKNGDLPVKLTDGSKATYTTSIAVSGTDVYVAGHDMVFVSGSNVEGVAKYWKNGTLVNLTDGSASAYASSIAVSGTDVYVAGTQWDGNAINYHDEYTVFHRNPIAKYWKNGKPVNLTDGSKWAEAKSIAVSGNDVYVAGFEDNVAKYWKNGTPVILGDVSKNSGAYSIFLVKK
jgi:hypothetical protein